MSALRFDRTRYGYTYWAKQECRRKKAYTKLKAAREALAKLNDPKMHVYRCLFCPAWHLGHMSAMYPEVKG